MYKDYIVHASYSKLFLSSIFERKSFEIQYKKYIHLELNILGPYAACMILYKNIFILDYMNACSLSQVTASFSLNIYIWNITFYVIWCFAWLGKKTWGTFQTVPEKKNLKLARTHTLYKPPPFFINIMSVSMHLLHRMDVNPHVICMSFVELWGTGHKLASWTQFNIQ